MGLQVSRCVYTETQEEAYIRCITPPNGRDISRVGRAQGIEDCGRAYVRGSRAYMYQHTAEVCGIECGGIYQREKCDTSSEDVWRSAQELYRGALLGSWVLCLDRRARRGHGTGLHTQPRNRRPTLRSDEAGNVIQPPWAAPGVTAPLRRSPNKPPALPGVI